MRTKLTRAELETGLATWREDAGLLHCALNDVLRGDVKWFGGNGKIRLGITRPCGAEGGILLHTHDGYTVARLWEQSWPNFRDYSPSPGNTDALRARELAMQAHEYIITEQSKLMPKAA